MPSAIALVSTVSTTLYQQDYALPTWAGGGFSTFHKVHALWRWKRNYLAVQNDDSIMQRHFLDTVFSWTVGDPLAIKIAAKIALLARRTVDAAEAHRNFSLSCSRLVDAITAERMPEFYVTGALRSPAMMRMEYEALRVYTYILHVWDCLIEWITDAFLLSMRLADVAEAIAYDPRRSNAHLASIYHDIAYACNELAINKLRLMQELESRKEIIDAVMATVGSQHNCADLTRLIGVILDTTIAAVNTADRIPHGFKKWLRDTGFVISFTLTGWAPRSWNPLNPEGSVS